MKSFLLFLLGLILRIAIYFILMTPVINVSRHMKKMGVVLSSTDSFVVCFIIIIFGLRVLNLIDGCFNFMGTKIKERRKIRHEREVLESWLKDTRRPKHHNCGCAVEKEKEQNNE